MKQLTLILLTMLLFSCSPRLPQHTDNYKIQLICSYKTYGGYVTTNLFCDSVQMINLSQASVWIDGQRNNINATQIRTLTNINYLNK